jgi:nucleoside phosphorylase
MEDVVVFAALHWERRAVSRALGASRSPVAPRTWAIRLARGRSGLLVETGMGSVRARAAALQAPAARAWIMMGCAGALAGWLRRGQAVAAEEIVVLDHDGRVAERLPAASGPLAAQAARHGMRVIPGAIAVTPAVMTDAGAKAAAERASRALVVEMESGALAAVARDRGIPFHALRVVLDQGDEKLPFGPDVFDEETGTVHLGRAIRALAPPSRWPVAVRLMRGQRAAMRTLAALAQVLADEGLPEAAQTPRAATA